MSGSASAGTLAPLEGACFLFFHIFCLPQERQEKALGILTYLGQSAAEAQTQPPWYQLPPRRGSTPSGPGPDEKIKRRLDPLREMQKHLGEKRKHSGDSGGHSTKEKKGPERQRPKE